MRSLSNRNSICRCMTEVNGRNKFRYVRNKELAMRQVIGILSYMPQKLQNETKLLVRGGESHQEFDAVIGRLSIDIKRAGFAHYSGDEEVLRQGPYNELQIILAGEGGLVRGGRSFSLKAPSICIIPLSETARIRNAPGLKKVFFQCNITYGGADILLNDAPRILPFTGDAAAWWERAVGSIPSGDVFAMKAMLYDALSMIRPVIEEIAFKKRDAYDRFAPFFEYVRRTSLRAISMGDIAMKFGVHKNYFSQEFKRHFGMPAKAYALSEKLRSAKALLIETGDDIPSIAEQLGFFDRFHFSKAFKKSTGVSPAEFRERSSEDASTDRP
ncbi:MAG: AraC family transcriptional regulator [Spirochaetota bacterium]